MNFPRESASRKKAAILPPTDPSTAPSLNALREGGVPPLGAAPEHLLSVGEAKLSSSGVPLPIPRSKGVTLEQARAAEAAAAASTAPLAPRGNPELGAHSTRAASLSGPSSGLGTFAAEAPPTPESPSAAPAETPSEPVAPEAPLLEWKDLGLSAEALELIEKAGYKRPTPVQAKAIPLALEGRDLIASSQTGTGKTAAFTIPMIEKLAGRKGPYGLILAPTREIAQQIQTTLQLLAEPRGLRSAVLIGGIDMRYDQQALANYPEIIVATPGRLCDHIERGNVWLEYIEFLILDEADRMLDMGFAEQLNKIVAATPDTRQTLLFSATFAAPVEKLAKKILRNPERLAMGRITAAKTVTQRLVFLQGEEEKNRELRAQLRDEKGSVIVFTRTKDGATRVFRMLHSASFYDVTYIHSDRIQAHREQALAEFRSGKYRILIATDVAGRGIHVDEVAHVINFDLPLEAEDYIHRVGRTGRAESTGKATSFATHRDRDLLKAIEKLLKGPIPVVPALTSDGGSPYSGTASSPSSAPSSPRSSGGRGGRGRGEGRDHRGRDEGPMTGAGARGTGGNSGGGAAPRSGSPGAGGSAGPGGQSNGPLRPSQRPGPIRAIDLLPPAEFYEGEADLDWASASASAGRNDSAEGVDVVPGGPDADAGDDETSPSQGHAPRDERGERSRRRRRRRGGGGKGGGGNGGGRGGSRGGNRQQNEGSGAPAVD